MVRLFFAVLGCTTIHEINVNGDNSFAAVKDAIAQKLQFRGSPTALTLYHTKHNTDGKDEWLLPLSTDLEALQQIHPSADVQQKYLVPDSLLYPMDFVEDKFIDVPPRVVHILVVVPSPSAKRSPTSFHEDESPTKLPRLMLSVTPAFLEQDAVSWLPALEKCPQVELPQEVGACLRIPSAYFDGSGVYAPATNGQAVLYIRKEVIDEWKEIQLESVDSASILYIVGAPGVGKSCASFAFACGSVDRTEWDVLWMHFNRIKERFLCVKFVGDAKWTCSFSAVIVDRAVQELFGHQTSSKPLIVFLDGYNKNFPPSERLRFLLNAWQQRDDRNRFVCVTSMASRGKEHQSLNMEPIEAPNGHTTTCETQFTLLSWTLEQYIAAVANHDFFDSVRAMLEPTTQPNTAQDRATSRVLRSIDAAVPPAPRPQPSPEDLVRQKFYLAGGSARAMFARSDRAVIKFLREAVNCVSDAASALAGNSGAASPNAVNRLFAVFAKENGMLHSAIVSQFATRQLAVMVGPDKILHLTSAICLNPAMDGFAFEAFVLSSVHTGGVAYKLAGQKKFKRWESKVDVFDPALPSSDFQLQPHWNVPTKWNQGGYDAVVRRDYKEDCSKMGLAFMQMTRSKQHGFKPEPFIGLLQKVREASQLEHNESQLKPLAEVELCYVVPTDVLNVFKLPISQSDFKRQVVDVAYISERRTRSPVVPDIKCTVRVVGVKYPLFQEYPDKWRD